MADNPPPLTRIGNPEVGKRAMTLIRAVLVDLGPDMAATVMTTALVKITMTIPADCRPQFTSAVQHITAACLLPAERGEADRRAHRIPEGQPGADAPHSN